MPSTRRAVLTLALAATLRRSALRVGALIEPGEIRAAQALTLLSLET